MMDLAVLRWSSARRMLLISFGDMLDRKREEKDCGSSRPNGSEDSLNSAHADDRNNFCKTLIKFAGS